ncbi:MAG TPA: hypothetical protein VGM50_19350 [Gemmatimonadaceae bacterium]|jgi:hypothetical protein
MWFVNAALAFNLLGGVAPQIQMSATRVDAARLETQRTCMSPAKTGTFRLTAMTLDSTNAKVGILLLENVDGCLEATFVMDDGGPAIIDHLALSGDEITGSVRMMKGTARVLLRVNDAGLAGSIMDGRREWRLSGKRTS